MTTVAERIAPQLPAPSRIGQATAVEQSRAVAEVQAAVVVAQQCPRDISSSVRQMKDACNRLALAERAFFRYDRAGEPITGPTISLARELARVWGNVQWGVVELRRDDEHGQSEMQAWAWDVQTNSRTSTTFIVPHRRDTKHGPKSLTQMRDIYENNANNGARRVREMIFGILPTWFTEEAQQLCSQTLERGDGKPLAERIAASVEAFGKLGITVAQMEAKSGPRAEWTANDVAQLGVIYQSIQRGETTKDREFEAAAATLAAGDIPERQPSGQRQAAERKPRQRRQASGPADPTRAAAADASEHTGGPADGQTARSAAQASSGQVGMIHTAFEKLGYEDHEREERLVLTAFLAGYDDDLETSSHLTEDQARRALGRLKDITDRTGLHAAVRRIKMQRDAQEHGEASE